MMESITFEKFGIDRCLNDNCNQLYNKDTITLAIWLHGLILLTQREVNTGGDELLGYVKQEKVSEEKRIGYIGITCPKCLKTKLYKKTVKEVREFKDFAAAMLKLNGVVENINGDSSIDLIGYFPLNLRYYSPFSLKRDIIKKFIIEPYGFDEPEDDSYFFDDFLIYIAGTQKDLSVEFCSYIIDDSTPVGTQTGIYWFKEQDIENILELENKRDEWIFPRYHYFSELMKKADSLWKYKYQSEKQFELAKADYAKLMQENIENLKHYTLKKGIHSEGTDEESGSNELPSFEVFLEKRKDKIVIDPKMTGDFFEVLISDPCPLKSLSGKPLENCDYLWVKSDLFSEEELPKDFAFENQSDEYDGRAQDSMKTHHKMVDRVRNNFTKQYVQEFLEKNLIDFLEEYEERFHSKQFSYAHVWELKESFLEKLYKATNKGLSSESPYVMKREMDAWIMVFNNIKSEKLLIGIGFAYIYYLLCNENEYYYHSELLPESGKTPKTSKDKTTRDETSGGIEAEPMTTKEDLKNMFDAINECKKDLEDASRRDEQKEVKRLEKRKTRLFKEVYEVYNPKTKKIRYYQHKNTKNAVDSVGKAIQRALEQLEKKNPKAHRHLFKALDGDHLFQETLSYKGC